MGHGHSHIGTAAATEIGTHARNVLIGFLAVMAVLAISGMIWLWPSPSQLAAATQGSTDAPGVTYESARIEAVTDDCPPEIRVGSGCQMLGVRLTSGPESGTQVRVELVGPAAQSGLQVGDGIEVARITTDGAPIYSYSGTDRLPVVIGLGVLFLVAVAAIARWRGIFAVLGLGFAAFVLLGFMVPALIVGRPGIIVTLVGSTAIMFVVLFVAHGINYRSSTALVGTLVGLYFTTALGALAVHLARLSGFAEETDYDLGSLLPGLNFQQLLMCAIIIGGLGVLNDVTITQSSSVFELRAAAPAMSRRDLFAAGMRIGRDHIASTIYTIVFAYAGSALSVLLLLFFTVRSSGALLGVEMFGSEVVRTLVSAVGLILSVPITTGIAALCAGPAHDADPESFSARRASTA